MGSEGGLTQIVSSRSLPTPLLVLRAPSSVDGSRRSTPNIVTPGLSRALVRLISARSSSLLVRCNGTRVREEALAARGDPTGRGRSRSEGRPVGKLESGAAGDARLLGERDGAEGADAARVRGGGGELVEGDAAHAGGHDRVPGARRKVSRKTRPPARRTGARDWAQR